MAILNLSIIADILDNLNSTLEILKGKTIRCYTLADSSAFPITVLFAIPEVPQLRVTPTHTSKSNSEKREHWGLWFEKH